MKIYLNPKILFLAVLILGTSCTKSGSSSPASTRTVKYVLYTNNDFSGNNDNIVFSLFMRNHTGILFDSALASMKIMEIPHSTNKIIIEKTVPDNDTSELSVGFLYSIEGVGNSWHLDTCKAGETLKVIEF